MEVDVKPSDQCCEFDVCALQLEFDPLSCSYSLKMSTAIPWFGHGATGRAFRGKIL